MSIIFKHQTCNVCESDDIQRICIQNVPKKFLESNVKFFNTSIVRCKYCGFYYLDPMPIDGVSELYDHHYFS